MTRPPDLTACALLFDNYNASTPANDIGADIDCWNAWRKGWGDILAGRHCFDGFGYHGASRNAYMEGRLVALEYYDLL